MSFKYRKDFAVFVLSHERADTITTVDFLRKRGYTGKFYVVIDDMDKQEVKYREKFGKNLIIFDKKKEAERADLGDNGVDLRIGVLARNFIIDKACDLGYKYHLQLDDDYTDLQYRFIKNDKMVGRPVKDLDRLFAIFIDFISKTDVCCFACAVGGDFIGGKSNKRYYDGLLRKCMNTFFLKADKKFYFKMRMNDDVTTNVLNTMRGKVFLSITYVQVLMHSTQSGEGGMTELYLDSGTYWKSFYTLMAAPSCSKIQTMNTKHSRIHHKIMWNNCAPKIIEEKYKKI